MSTRTKSHASHTLNNFFIYLVTWTDNNVVQSTGNILLQNMLFKMLEIPLAGDF